MLTLQSSLYALALAACVFCVLIFRNAKARPLVFLYVFLGLISASFIFEWLMMHPSWPFKALWLGSLMATSLLIAPCCWLFAKEITDGKTPSLHSLAVGHFAAIALGIISLLPLLQTVHWGSGFANPDHSLSAGQLLFMHSTMLIAGCIFLLQAPFYLALCIRVLRKHTNHVKVLFSNIRDRTYNTLRILSLIVLMHWLISLLRILHCMFLGADTGLGVYFACVQVAVTLWAVLAVVRQTTVFSIDDRQLIEELTETENLSVVSKPRYANSALDAPARQRISRKLTEVLGSRELYRNNDLSLRELCGEVGENPHYVSQVISQDFGTRFYDLINCYRIEYASNALLTEPDKTVIDIALEAGFNSKSSFNAAFRRHTGTTPTEFRKRGNLGEEIDLPRSNEIVSTSG